MYYVMMPASTQNAKWGDYPSRIDYTLLGITLRSANRSLPPALRYLPSHHSSYRKIPSVPLPANHHKHNHRPLRSFQSECIGAMFFNRGNQANQQLQEPDDYDWRLCCLNPRMRLIHEQTDRQTDRQTDSQTYDI